MQYQRLLHLLDAARDDAMSLAHVELAEMLADAEFLALSRIAETALAARAHQARKLTDPEG